MRRHPLLRYFQRGMGLQGRALVNCMRKILCFKRERRDPGSQIVRSLAEDAHGCFLTVPAGAVRQLGECSPGGSAAVSMQEQRVNPRLLGV
mgnify:CR=1 FL=1